MRPGCGWRRGFIGAVLLGAAWPAVAAVAPPSAMSPGPSFDCGKATLAVEKDICADADLAAADRRLAAIFAEARREGAPPQFEDGGSLLQEQRKWVASRNECHGDDGLDAQCLHMAYDGRAKALLVSLPFLQKVREPLSAADVERLIGLFRLMAAGDLNAVTGDSNGDALAAASCRFFERFPQEATVVFGAYDYSTRDSWTPLCRTRDVATAVPAVASLVRVLEIVEAGSRDCGGTMYYGRQRDQAVMRILALVDPHPDFAAYDKARRHDDEAPLGYHPDVAHWGLQGLWQKRRHAELERAVAVAKPALAADYRKRFQLAPAAADRLADHYVGQLIDRYTRHTGASSTLSYYSLCLTRKDLDGYLQSGVVPVKPCPDQEHAEAGQPAVLRRLLGLAVVNDYPLAAVRRLLAAGASLNPPGQSVQEPHESLLMLAAARAEVIAALLAAGADPNPHNEFGKTALMYAAQEGNAEGVKRLLAAGADANAATAAVDLCGPHIGGRTALMYAARQGNVATLRLLLAAGADARRADSDGKTAAAYAAANRSLSPAARQAAAALLTPTP